MTPEELLEQLRSGSAPDDLKLLSAFVDFSRLHRAEAEDGLAYGEWKDGLYVEEEEARRLSQVEPDAGVRLAAAPMSAPVSFTGEGWELRARQDGDWYLLLMGPSPVRIHVLGSEIRLPPRVWTRLPTPILPREFLLLPDEGPPIAVRRPHP